MLISFGAFPLGTISVLPFISYNATNKLTAKYPGKASIDYIKPLHLADLQF
jgi:hypothetical protein